MLHFSLTDEARDQLKSELQIIYDKAQVYPYVDEPRFHKVLAYLVAQSLPEEVRQALDDLRHGKGDPVIHISNLPQDDDINAEVNLKNHTLERPNIPEKSYISEYVLLGLTAARDTVVDLSIIGDMPINQIANQNGYPNRNAQEPGEAQTILEMPYHNDFGHAFDTVSLYCLQGNDKAVTSFITADAIVDSLRKTGKANILEELTKEHFWNVNEPDEYFSILKETGNGTWQVCYTAYKDIIQAATTEGQKALEAFKEHIHNDCPTEQVVLKAGEVIVSDNLRTIHRQERFTTSLDKSQSRWLQRALGKNTGLQRD